MNEPVSHIVIPGLRKSANVFIRRAIELTLGCPFVPFVDAWDDALPDRFDAFFASERAVGGEHLAASARNLAMLAAHRVTRIAVLMRDPRDALISWWHHLERSDVKAARLRRPVSNTFVPPDYYTLAPEEKLRALIIPGMATMQSWMAAWVDVADTSPSMRVHFNRFEDFAADQRGGLGLMLAFFGHDIEPVLPQIDAERDAGIHPSTHFRRGRPGSHRDEASSELVRMMDERLDRRLGARMGWV